jgi:hypothetical protein
MGDYMMKIRSASILLVVFFVLVIFGQASMGQGLERAKGWAWSGIAATTLEHQGEPAPAPQPGDTCQACKGSGKVGDGTIFKKCLDCDGNGKIKAAMKAAGKKVSDVLSVLPGLDAVVSCPDGRCDSRPPAQAAAPQPQKTQAAPQVCSGGVCYPVTSAKQYQAYRPQVVRRGFIFRR